MKKTYQSPTLSIVTLDRCYTLQTASGLDGFGGSGGSGGSGKEADARSHNWDAEDEEYEDY